MSKFFTQRGQGLIGWHTLFWRDLLVIGTSMNLLMTGSALALLSQGVALHWVLGVHLLQQPYNLLIVSALWRAPQRPPLVLGVSVFWMVLFVLV